LGENEMVDMPHTPRTIEAPFTDVPGAVADIRAGRIKPASALLGAPSLSAQRSPAKDRRRK